MQNTAAGVTGQRDMGVKEVSYKDVLAFKKNTISIRFVKWNTSFQSTTSLYHHTGT